MNRLTWQHSKILNKGFSNKKNIWKLPVNMQGMIVVSYIPAIVNPISKAYSNDLINNMHVEKFNLNN